MDPDRFKVVSRIFEAALARRPEERSAFVAEACSGDLSLRAEVEGLLSSHHKADGFLEEPPTAPVGMALAAGTRLGPYEIVALAGAGGMGEVYRARDPRLGREVAIKVLSSAGPTPPGALERFRAEARAIGALNHPNILAVYDVGEEQGAPYVVTELLEGETLRQRLRRGPIPSHEAVRQALQIASGLSAAHEKGIVHRDLKPENLFLTRDGSLKILDFGLAKRLSHVQEDLGQEVGAGLTRPGLLLGTVGYMSPEQAQGRAADARSDLFALGAVLYEMLAGRRAFTGGSDAESLAAVLRDDPPALSSLRPDVPPALDDVVARCLCKDSASRFATAREVASALESLRSSRRRSVAVLPFRALGEDPDAGFFGVALADATITELARHRTLLVRPTSTILRYSAERPDPSEAARALGVDAVVDGSYQRTESRLRVTVQLVSSEGEALWAGRVDTSVEDILRVQDEVARAITAALEVEMSADPARHSGHAELVAGRAYEHYLRGRSHFLRETLDDCIAAADWFEKARETDPGFALAWAGLADAYARMGFDFQPEGNWYARARAMCDRALTLDPDLPEGHYARARLRWSPQGGWDNAGALRDLMLAVASRPSLDDAHLRAGVILYHVGLIDEALLRLRRVLMLSPDHLLARYHVAFCRYHLGADITEGLRVSQDVAQRAPARWITYQAALYQVRLGRLDEAEETVGRMREAHAIRALVAALQGDAPRAHDEIRLTAERRKAFGNYHHNQYEVACALARLGEVEPAIDWLLAASRGGYPCVTLFERDPYLDPLRGSARFDRLIADLRLEREGYRGLYAGLMESEGDGAPTRGGP